MVLSIREMVKLNMVDFGNGNYLVFYLGFMISGNQTSSAKPFYGLSTSPVKHLRYE